MPILTPFIFDFAGRFLDVFGGKNSHTWFQSSSLKGVSSGIMMMGGNLPPTPFVNWTSLNHTFQNHFLVQSLQFRIYNN